MSDDPMDVFRYLSAEVERRTHRRWHLREVRTATEPDLAFLDVVSKDGREIEQSARTVREALERVVGAALADDERQAGRFLDPDETGWQSARDHAEGLALRRLREMLPDGFVVRFDRAAYGDRFVVEVEGGIGPPRHYLGHGFDEIAREVAEQQGRGPE